MAEIHLPRGAVDADDVWSWYGNIAVELEALGLEPALRDYFADYYEEAGLLVGHRRSFFRRHFSESFARSADFLLGDGGTPVVVDLGAGSGTQALYLALRGATVLAVDMDAEALEILRRRISFYEQRAGRTLHVRIIEGNAFEVDYAVEGPVDAIWSMFAFNMMQPSADLVDRMLEAAAPNVRVAILDGNNESLFARFVPARHRDVWSPRECGAAFAERGFEVVEHRGGVVIPPRLWSVVPYGVSRGIDELLRDNWWAPVSHLYLGQRAPRG